MPIHAQVFAFGDAVHQFDFIRFVVVLIKFDRIGAGPDFGFHRVTGVDDVFHLRFDLTQIFWCEWFGAVEIVEPAVVTNRADGDFDVGPDFLNRAGHDVRQIVADQFQRRFIVLHGVDGDFGVFGDRPLQIPMRTIHGRRDCFFRKRSSDGCSDFGRGNTCVVVTRIAIRESQGNLAHFASLLVSLAPTERPVAG